MTKTKDFPVSADAKAVSRTIDTLALGCKPASVVRELFHNCADALIRGGVSAENPGEIRIARDTVYPLKTVFANSIPGDPLTEEIAKTCLASIGSTGNDEQENFGIGAKISYLPRHPEGLTYRSKTEGEQFTFYKNHENIYALKQEETDDGPTIFCACDDDEFAFSDSETEVVLMGASVEVDTWIETCTITSKAGEASETGYSIRDYLNMRYWESPDPHINTKVMIYESGKDPFLTAVRFLKSIKESRKLNGTLKLNNGVKIHYFTTNFKKGQKMGTHVTTGYYGYIYNNEIYFETDIEPSVRKRRMQNLGVMTHHKQVMVLVEFPPTMKLRPTADRTRIVDSNGTDVEYLLVSYADYFKDNMPEDLKAWMQSLHDWHQTDVVKEASKYFKNNSNVINLPSVTSGTDAEGDSSDSDNDNTEGSNGKPGNPPRKRKRKASRAGTKRGTNGGAPEFMIDKDSAEDEPLISFPLRPYIVMINVNNLSFTYFAKDIAASVIEANDEYVELGLAEQFYLQTCEYYAMLNKLYGQSESDDRIEERMGADKLDAVANYSVAKQAKARIRSKIRTDEKTEQLTA